MWQTIKEIGFFLLLCVLAVVIFIQYKAIGALRDSSVSLSKQLSAFSTSVKSDFTDWTGRLDTIQAGYSNIESTVAGIQGSFAKRDKIDERYRTEVRQGITGLSDQLNGIYSGTIATGEDADKAIGRLENFGEKLAGFIDSKGK